VGVFWAKPLKNLGVKIGNAGKWCFHSRGFTILKGGSWYQCERGIFAFLRSPERKNPQKKCGRECHLHDEAFNFFVGRNKNSAGGFLKRGVAKHFLFVWGELSHCILWSKTNISLQTGEENIGGQKRGCFPHK